VYGYKKHYWLHKILPTGVRLNFRSACTYALMASTAMVLSPKMTPHASIKALRFAPSSW